MCALALGACFFAAAPGANGQSFTVTDLGVLAARDSSSATALNNQNVVAGTSSFQGARESAFLFYRGKASMYEIGNSPLGSVSRAFGINDAGIAVGDSNFGTDISDSLQAAFSRAAIFLNGSVADLGMLKGATASRAQDINNAGMVVGSSGNEAEGEVTRAFVWSAGTGMVAIDTLGGSSSEAMSINDAGFVTGNSETAGERFLGTRHAFLYDAGNSMERPTQPIRDLGTLGGSSSYGTSINLNNHVAGYSTTGDERVHAFFYNGSRMQDLGSLGGKDAASDQSFALGISADDQVVGYSFRPFDGTRFDSFIKSAPEQVAFLYRQGAMRDLNEMIGTARGEYHLYSATAINDRGQIAANALHLKSKTVHAVLLTPLAIDPPEPTVRNTPRSSRARKSVSSRTTARN